VGPFKSTSTYIIKRRNQLQPPPPIIDTGDVGRGSPLGGLSPMRQFASVPSPLAAAPMLSSPVISTPSDFSPKVSLFDPTATMRHVSHNTSSSDHAFTIPASTTHSDSAMILSSAPALRAVDITRLANPETLFDELQRTAADLGTWLNIIQGELDDILDDDLEDVPDAEHLDSDSGSHTPFQSVIA
jgi:hypothetical protein